MVMRVVFMGTPEFALPSLTALTEDPDRYQVVAVLTRPDRPSGRGQKARPSPVKQLARRLDLPLLEPARLREQPRLLERLRELAPEVMVVAAYGHILPPEIFNLPPLGTVNVHASLLPRYRGAAPVARAIMAGERETGVSLMKVSQGLDEGDVLAQKRVPIGDEMTAGELTLRLAREGAGLLVRTLPAYARGELEGRPQDPQQASYAPRLSKAEAAIDWRLSAPQIHNQVRALNPWPVALTHLRGEPLKVWRTTVLESGGCAPAPGAGCILALEGSGIVVACGEGTLALREVQPPARRRMGARDFANGIHLRVGECLN